MSASASPSPSPLPADQTGTKHTIPGTSVPTRFARSTFVPVKETQWVPDRDRDACRSCAKPFHMLRRKHHCRADADIYCSTCSRFRLIAKANTYELVHVRVCAQCFDLHAAPDGDSLHQPLSLQATQAPSDSEVPQSTTAAHSAAPTDSASTDPSQGSTNSTSGTRDIGTSPMAFHTVAAVSTAAVAVEHRSVASVSQSSSEFVRSQPRKIAGAAGGLLVFIVLMCAEGSVPWSAGLMLLALVGAGTGLHAANAHKPPPAATTPSKPHVATTRLLDVTTIQSSACTVTTITSDASVDATKPRAISAADSARPPVHAHPPSTTPRTRPRSLTQQLVEAHSATLPPLHHAPLHTSSSFPNGFAREASADLEARARLSSASATQADLIRLGLSREDAELVLLSRAALATVQSYHADLDGWRTHIHTRPDGRGKVKLPEGGLVDFDALAAVADDTVVVQSKFFSKSKSASARTVWKGVCVLRCPPSHVFRLLHDQANQCEWNTALILSKVLRAIPHTRTSITYTVSAPAVGGAVSSRDFIDTHDWSMDKRTGPGSLASDGGAHVDYAFAGVGLDKSLYPYPSAGSFVRGLNGPAGFLFRSIDAPQLEGGPRGRSTSDAAVAGASSSIDLDADCPSVSSSSSADPDGGRFTQLVVVLDTDVRGWVPRSLTDGAMPDVVLEYMRNMQRVWKERIEKKAPLPPLPTDVYGSEEAGPAEIST